LTVFAFTAAQSQTKVETVLTAVSANVKEPGSPVRIHLFRWSAEEERTPLLTALNPPPAPPAAAGGAGERGAAGRAGRAAGRGRAGRGAAPLTPIAAFTAAIGRAPTIGYIWTNDVTGYSIKYAYRSPSPDGGERVVLVTDRRMGANTVGWNPVVTTPLTDYEFTVIEIHLDPKGVGEGKTSLTTQVVIDKDARTVALENYTAAPAILQNVKRAAGG
jgi:hypothetical protein